eukprot:TRINITY_DN478_c0_g1_i11.p1 TRINITY_DN478_c0_g1~~TRINITY_DN478_c0_g1_i11.p1  ORF type:complete len:322 (+),score=70.68 TRINITY_DN478_c0_g1_i11:542-1507(+)
MLASLLAGSSSANNAFLVSLPHTHEPATAAAPTAAQQVASGSAAEKAPQPGASSSAISTYAGLAVVGAAIAGTRRASSSRHSAAGVTALKAFENELGVQPPTGFWDPAGFTSDGDAKEFRRRRCVEIKHGRISMLACIGYIVPEYVKWPGYISPTDGIKFTDIPNGLAAFSKVPALGWGQMVGFALQLELAKEFRRRRCVEIKHGRISMLACIGYIVPEYVKWPGYISPTDGIKFTDIPNGLAAFSKVPALGWGQMVGFALQLELFGAYQQPTFGAYQQPTPSLVSSPPDLCLVSPSTRRRSSSTSAHMVSSTASLSKILW